MITRRHLLLSFVSSSILLASIINTPVSAYNYIGDVNLDNEVNSSDASQILIHSALVGSGSTSMFTEQQLALSDFNHDNTTDASDAAAILIASASIGAGDNVELETQPVVTDPPADNDPSSDGGFVPDRGGSHVDTDQPWDGSDPGDANYATNGENTIGRQGLSGGSNADPDRTWDGSDPGDNVELETQPVVTDPPADNGNSTEGIDVSDMDFGGDTDRTWDGSDPGDANYATNGENTIGRQGLGDDVHFGGDTDWTWDGSDPGDAYYATDPPANTNGSDSSDPFAGFDAQDAPGQAAPEDFHDN